MYLLFSYSQTRYIACRLDANATTCRDEPKSPQHIPRGPGTLLPADVYKYLHAQRRRNHRRVFVYTTRLVCRLITAVAVTSCVLLTYLFLVEYTESVFVFNNILYGQIDRVLYYLQRGAVNGRVTDNAETYTGIIPVRNNTQ